MGLDNNLDFEKEWQPGKQYWGYLFCYKNVEMNKKKHIFVSSTTETFDKVEHSAMQNLQEKGLDNSDT